MKWVFLLLFSALFLRASSQPIAQNLTDDLQLPVSDFYMIAQHHNSAANNIIDEALFFQLNQKHGVRFNIIEYSHSAAFLINRFLDTGDTSYLEKIHESAPFTFIKKIKKWNDLKATTSQIRFYGIDFEGRYNGRITKAAIAEILHLSGLAPSDRVFPLFSAVINAEESMMSQALSNLFKGILGIGENEQTKLAPFTTDLMLILKANYGFSVRRDVTMFNSFTYLYKQLAGKENPKFYASFGIGHVNLQNPKGLSSLLMYSESSPVKGQVSMFAVQYINSYFGAQPKSRTTGHISGLCSSRSLLSEETQGGDFRIRYIPAKDLQNASCKNKLALFTGALIVENSPASQFWLWE